MSTVLVVDNVDVVFLYALAVQLKKHAIWLIPADSVEQAHLWREHIGPKLDVLIINCAMHSVCQFAVEMLQRVPGLRIMGVASEGHRCGSCKESLSVIVQDHRPRQDDDMWQWMRAIQSLIQ